MGYSAAPWTFKGRALYQLQLVRSEEARKYIPQEFELVEFMGWTLGGVYLARYDDSPVGSFDECVVMAGLVWNAPMSCAWAGRVFVSNKEARDHGLRHVGLPSRLATFQGTNLGIPKGGCQPRGALSWWRKGREQRQQGTEASKVAASGSLGVKLGLGGSGGFVDAVELRNLEKGRRGLQLPVATFKLAPMRTKGFLGPRMRLSLPSFSGGTADHPDLLKYSCDLQTNVMPVTPIKIEMHHSNDDQQQRQQKQQGTSSQGGEDLDSLLGGKPLVALAFSDMVMLVDEPLHLNVPQPATRPTGSRAALLATVPPRP